MRLLEPIDYFLNRITMYRLVLYYLIVLIVAAMAFGSIGLIPVDPVALGLTAVFWCYFSAAVNDLFSKIFSAPANLESVYITGLILALIVPPAKDVSDFIGIAAIACLSVISKFLLAYRRKHIFNPAAIAVFLSGMLFNLNATWWVGNLPMMVFVLIGGLMVVRKVRREAMVMSFFLTTVAISFGIAAFGGRDIFLLSEQLIFHSSLLFFMFAMLTEPLTSPRSLRLQIAFGVLTGILFVPDVHIGPLYLTPEAALLAGNLFSYLASPKDRLVLHLTEKVRISPDCYDFMFDKPAGFTYIPGQYMEWTLPQERTDSRGSRRYFTLASSPTEQTIRLGVKFYPNGSTYKNAMSGMRPGDAIVASEISGDFILPDNPTEKLACIAGGIGVTPFRSMLAYLTDRNEKRDIVLLYSNRTRDDILYRDVFDRATTQGIAKVTYVETQSSGRLDAKAIAGILPDFRERLFYVSGSDSFVNGIIMELKMAGVGQNRIKRDFFPGLV